MTVREAAVESNCPASPSSNTIHYRPPTNPSTMNQPSDEEAAQFAEVLRDTYGNVLMESLTPAEKAILLATCMRDVRETLQELTKLLDADGEQDPEMATAARSL